VTPSARREVVGFLKSQHVSERRACHLVSLQRSTFRYRSRRDDSELIERIRALASERPRFGYRRIHALIRRERRARGDEPVNRKRVHRIYREQGLAVRRRRRRKLRSVRQEPLQPTTAPNQRWAMDFVHDWLVGGRRLRTLNIVDTFTRECLAIEVDTSLRGQRVASVLDAVTWKYGVPECIVVDNGPEFISLALDKWAAQHGVRLHFIDPGKPMQNGHCESFNSRFRDECLSQIHFVNLVRGRTEIELWRVDYNTRRPHSALGYQTPEEFAAPRRAALARAASLPAGGLSGKASSDGSAAHGMHSPTRAREFQVGVTQNEGVT
jgi:putative transposase